MLAEKLKGGRFSGRWFDLEAIEGEFKKHLLPVDDQAIVDTIGWEGWRFFRQRLRQIAGSLQVTGADEQRIAGISREALVG